MTASPWLVALLACAQAPGEPPSQPAASKIVAVTVYQGQALVTREVAVPPGAGTVELVVSPLPPRVVEGSLFTEGADGLRVLSTRARTRAVRKDTRAEVRAQEEQIEALRVDAQRLQDQVTIHDQDLQFLRKLEGFAGASLNQMTEKGRLDSKSVLALSDYINNGRGERLHAETELRLKIERNTADANHARERLAELSSGSARTERDAVIVVTRDQPGAGTVRLGYLVEAANWVPQYRLRSAGDDGPVRLESLAAVTQQTGEAWPGIALTLSTARPTLDAAPPELLPLRIEVEGSPGPDAGPAETRPDQSRKVAAELERVAPVPFPNETALAAVIKHIRQATQGPAFPDGVPIYLDPHALQNADKTAESPVALDLPPLPLKTSLRLVLEQVSLAYRIRDGVVMIYHPEEYELEGAWPRTGRGIAGMGGMGGAMGGAVGGGMSLEMAQATGTSRLNQEAAAGQGQELQLSGDFGGPAQGAEGEVAPDGPSVSMAIAGSIDIPSRAEPALLEVDKAELPAERYAKAVPVLTPRVYRQARLTNAGNRVILPGQATVYVGSEFVGRMNLPLVAAGEPFLAGFGVDPQVQLGRRLMTKTRTVQGGNQVFAYEFRINVHNRHAGPVKVELWNRLPMPEGEAVAVNLAKTSAELSTDALYLRTARKDNLLRWDLDVPAGAAGDRAVAVTYEFRIEYARDLPQPKFRSGGLGEGPIGGGAMGGGMGGMGGLLSVPPARD